MTYFNYINNGKGPTKLFVGGLHGKEGLTTIKLIEQLIPKDYNNGKFYK
ncbi:DUF2119 family protein [Methanobrevibacter filiformis]|nr:DUF2119 family protein [Methanobrevibacter filiformis]